jgi:hypothetical protein
MFIKMSCKRDCFKILIVQLCATISNLQHEYETKHFENNFFILNNAISMLGFDTRISTIFDN